MSRVRETVAQRVEREKTRPVDPAAIVDDTFLTNAEIAAQYAISTDFVLAAQNRGELPYCSFGRRRSSPRRAVQAWAASRLVTRT